MNRNRGQRALRAGRELFRLISGRRKRTRATPSPFEPHDPAGAPAREPGALPAVPREIPEAIRNLRHAASALLGELDVAALPPSQQRALFAELVRGKVQVFAVHPLHPQGPSRLRFGALATAELAERLAVEQRRCERERAAYLDAQRLLAAAGIPLVLFKTLGPYPYGARQVDALVPSGELERAAQALERDGFFEMVHCDAPYERLFRRFEGAQCRLALRLHEQLRWMLLQLGDRDELWASARPGSDPFVVCPAPEHVIAALFAYSVYQARTVQLGELWTVRSAVGDPRFDWSEVERIARVCGWTPGLELACAWYAAAERLAFGSSLIGVRAPARTLAHRLHARIDGAERTGRWPLALPGRTLRSCFLRTFLCDPKRATAQKLTDLRGRLRARRRPTSFVYLCGLDAEGRATQAEAIRVALEACGIPSRRIWQRTGRSRPLRWLTHLSRVLSAGQTDPRARAHPRPMVSAAWAWWIALEQLASAWIALGAARSLGQVAVGERYLPDALAELAERFHAPDPVAHAAARLMCRLAPQPDLILWLDVPSERALARKLGCPVEVVQARRALYRRVLERFARVETLDATRPAQELEREIVDRALRTVLDRIRMGTRATEA